MKPNYALALTAGFFMLSAAYAGNEHGPWEKYQIQALAEKLPKIDQELELFGTEYKIKHPENRIEHIQSTIIYTECFVLWNSIETAIQAIDNKDSETIESMQLAKYKKMESLKKAMEFNQDTEKDFMHLSEKMMNDYQNIYWQLFIASKNSTGSFFKTPVIQKSLESCNSIL